jgi:ArsR family transcriptional regulator, arsenate/arsenite/antimonite-responsive transcriptional repressor
MILNHKKNAKVFKAFCDEQRLKILYMLKDGEKCACKLLSELEISQSTLSHHMKILCDSGIVKCRKDGKWTHYTIDNQNSNQAIQILSNLIGGIKDE